MQIRCSRVGEKIRELLEFLSRPTADQEWEDGRHERGVSGAIKPNGVAASWCSHTAEMNSNYVRFDYSYKKQPTTPQMIVWFYFPQIYRRIDFDQKFSWKCGFGSVLIAVDQYPRNPRIFDRRLPEICWRSTLENLREQWLHQGAWTLLIAGGGRQTSN